MTVSTTASSTTVEGNGITTSFAYAFIIPTAASAVITLINNTVDPATSTQLSSSQYSITGLANPAGGTVTYPLTGSPIAEGYALTIARVVPLQQLVSIANQGGFFPEAIEAALDNLEMQIQQIVPPGPPPFPNFPIPTATDFGATGDGTTDDTVALQAWLDAGGGILPPTSDFYKVTSVLLPPANSSIYGVGPTSLIKLALAAGTPVVPVIDVRSAATGVKLISFAVDHDAAALAQNTIYGGDPAAASAIIIQADNCQFDGLQVSNAFGNGIFVAQYTSLAGGFNANLPRGIIGSNTLTITCGIGDSTFVSKPGKNGAGIDYGGCTGSVLTNCVDRQSYTGFIIDIGDGAICAFSNLSAYFTQLDATHPTNGSGTGFYFGAFNCQVSNCQAIETGGIGFWLDGAGAFNQISNCYARICGAMGFYIKGDWQMSNCVAYNCSQSSVTGIAGTTAFHVGAPHYDAFAVQTPGADINNLSMVGCFAYGNTHEYGYAEYPAGHSIFALSAGGAYFGLNGAGTTSGAFSQGFLTQNRAAFNLISSVIGSGMPIEFETNKGRQFQVADSGVVSTNFAFAKGNAAGSAAILGAFSDVNANVDLKLEPHGNGVVNFGTVTASTITHTGFISMKDAAGNPIKVMIGA